VLIRTTFFIALLAVFSGEPVAAQSPAHWCRNDASNSWMMMHIRQALAYRDSAGVGARRRMLLPEVPPDSALFVSDERVCEQAARAYYRYRLGPMPGGVEVARVADHYYVYGRNRAGEWTILTIFTLRFHDVASIAL
jgi:hypothetical protein